MSQVRRFSSRRRSLDRSFLTQRLHGARAYDRIAGYFSSSLLEVAGEALESVAGPVRMVANSDLHPADVAAARLVETAVLRAWNRTRPERLLDGPGGPAARARLRRLHDLLRSGKLQVRVLPDAAFGLVHGKAGVITLGDGTQTAFLGSMNETRAGWQLNYELLWEDTSPEAVAWVQTEFDTLWRAPQAVGLGTAVVNEIARLADRRVYHAIDDWLANHPPDSPPEPAAAVIETPVYREQAGLWDHQKQFVHQVFTAHHGPWGKARFVLADQVGLGKTLQLAMSAQLIALTGKHPVLIICPKTLTWQWQGEMRDLLDMPSAVWDGRRWVDESGYATPPADASGVLRCPRRVGIVSSGLIISRSPAAEFLLGQRYDCVILDEAHHARRKNLGEKRDHEQADPNNLLRFMRHMALQTRSLLLATATPVQLRPVEAWDLLDILSQGEEAVLGNAHSRWRRAPEALDLVMERVDAPRQDTEIWEWLRNPLPPGAEDPYFAGLRRRLEVGEETAVVPGRLFERLGRSGQQRLRRRGAELLRHHHPFIHRIVRRTRQQLEQPDPRTGEPLLQPIAVELLGERDEDAIPLPSFLHDAYKLAEEFCALVGERAQSAGFVKTLLLRRAGSTMHAGRLTALRMLGEATPADLAEEDAPDDEPEPSDFGNSLNAAERALLRRYVQVLETNVVADPKVAVVVACLRERGWLEKGCIVFSQYRDSIEWLVGELTQTFPAEPIAVYSGPSASGLMYGGAWTPMDRDQLKDMVQRDELRLMLGTDAAAEGLNLQRLATLINLDLPWNPTRLEQRKGRIQRIGQRHSTVQIYNMRYRDSVEDRVHAMLSNRLRNVYDLFGQLPDVLEDAWVRTALGRQEEAQRVIDAVPQQHPFELKYTEVTAVNWESCREVLSAQERRRVLRAGW